jgi:LuxR family maltose regulon positive regulatory protein
VTGQRAQAESVLDDLERGLSTEPVPPDAQALLASVAADRAGYAAMRGEVRLALEWARPALAAVPADAPSASAALARLRPASVLGLASLRAGNVAEAGQAFELAITAAQQTGVPIAALPLLCNLAEVRYVQGQLRHALECCDRADELAADQLSADAGRPTWGAGFVLSMRARIAYERGDLDAAQSCARQAIELLRQSRVTLGQETLLGLLARIEQARGEPKAANAALEQALQIARGNDVQRLVSLALASQAHVRLAQGALRTAARWADAYARNESTEYLREFEDLALAQVRLVQGQPDVALAVLARLLPPAEAAGRWGTAIEALALRALALHATGQSGQAPTPLRRALEQGEPEGYVRPFVEGGARMHVLLLQASRQPNPAPIARYIEGLLATFGAPPTLSPAASQRQTLIEPLTARELDVLDLLAQGLTNAEIGQRLVISLPTVKSHTRNLYGKLGVHSRRAAVAHARELGLLNP